MQLYYTEILLGIRHLLYLYKVFQRFCLFLFIAADELTQFFVISSRIPFQILLLMYWEICVQKSLINRLRISCCLFKGLPVPLLFKGKVIVLVSNFLKVADTVTHKLKLKTSS